MAASKFGRRGRRNSESGMAMIEALPILFLFLVLISYGLGYFGVVHSAVLNSISARTYAFETFRNRADLRLFRDSTAGATHFEDRGARLHAIRSEGKGAADVNIYATPRPLSFAKVYRPNEDPASVQEHNVGIYNIQGRNRKGGVEVSPAWIMVGYGICLNARCGP